MVGMLISFILLLAFCVPDIRTRKLNTLALLSAIAAAVVFRAVRGEITDGFWGGMEGCAVLLVSVFTRGKLGRGDALLLTATGILLGIERNTELFLTALFLCAVWAGYLLVIRRRPRNYELPFVPFLAAAQFIWIMIDLCIYW